MITHDPDAWDAKPISLLWSQRSNQIPGVRDHYYAFVTDYLNLSGLFLSAM